jgi:hypothetical protein
VWNVNHNPKGNYKIECRATRTSDKCEGRIRCLGGVSIDRSHPPWTPLQIQISVVKIDCSKIRKNRLALFNILWFLGLRVMTKGTSLFWFASFGKGLRIFEIVLIRLCYTIQLVDYFFTNTTWCRLREFFPMNIETSQSRWVWSMIGSYIL